MHIQKLKKVFNEARINLSTSDISKPDFSNAVLRYGLKVKRLKNIDKENYYLIALESQLIDNTAISTKYHNEFNKIFTLNSTKSNQFKNDTFANIIADAVTQD